MRRFASSPYYLFSILLLLAFNTRAANWLEAAIENQQTIIQLTNTADGLFTYKLKGTNTVLKITAPSFEIDGKQTKLLLKNIKELPSITLRNNVIEHSFSASLASNSKIAVKLFFRIADDSPVIRFRYSLTSDKDVYLTKS